MAKNSYWEDFCSLPPSERKWLAENCLTVEELTENMLTLSGRVRKLTKVKSNQRETDEAGRFAESYQGQGWFFLRGLLISFHEYMLKIESSGEPVRLQCQFRCGQTIALKGEPCIICANCNMMVKK